MKRAFLTRTDSSHAFTESNLGVPFFAALIIIVAMHVSAATSPARAGELHPTFPLLDDSGQSVLETGRPVSSDVTCGSCHDTGFIRQHNSHAEVGIDCFLCHVPGANDEARRRSLQSAAPAWSATATLLGTGIVERSIANESHTERTAAGFTYNPSAFDEDGHVRASHLTLQDPKSEACGSCHGAVHVDMKEAFTWANLDESAGVMDPEWTSLRTGQVYSAQPMRESGLNLHEKSRLTRSWDAHAERQLECVDCHYSVNNPIYRRASKARPAHLRFDARRIELGEYLKRPSHVLAHGVELEALTDDGEHNVPTQRDDRGRSVSTLAEDPDGLGMPGSMRDCATCHDPSAGHDWLPYADRHFATVSCASCHIPTMHAPALRTVDATLVDANGSPRIELRAVEGDASQRWGFDISRDMAATYVTGFEPTLLPRKEADGKERLAPHNLVTTYRWVTGDSRTEISPETLAEVFYDAHGRPRDSLIRVFDSNGDGSCSEEELRLSTTDQVESVRSLLIDAGFHNPQIEAVTEPFAITHGVAGGQWALRDCAQCHSDNSRVDRSVLLAASSPPGVTPRFSGDRRTTLAGSIHRAQHPEDTIYSPSPAPSLYVLGKHANLAADRVGLVAVLLTVLGIAVHSLLRLARSRRTAGSEVSNAGGAAGEVHTVYMYNAYERFWHWLQAAAIFVLLLTGLEIHFPGNFRVVGFDLAVRSHNIMGFVVVINAALSAFYHFASGEIRQFVPEPQGFFRGAILQIRYYLRGIFRGDPHPFEKHPGRKMNVLQQVTYLAILNLLLPLQIGTGLLMWGAQRWSSVDSVFGGLGVLGPIHVLGAWLFAAFLVVHIYLTTTGPTPTAYVKAMVTGWEDEPASHVAGGSSK